MIDSLNKIRELINSTLLLKNTDFATLIKHHLSQIEEEFEDYKARSVSWSISDFESIAKELSGDTWELIYDKRLFQQALEKMVKNHDTTEGITWNTIHYYLDEYCKK